MNIIFNKEISQTSIIYKVKNSVAAYAQAKSYGCVGKIGQMFANNTYELIVCSSADLTPHSARKLGCSIAESIGTKNNVTLDLTEQEYAVEILEGFYLRYWNFSKYHVATQDAHVLHLENFNVICKTDVETHFQQLLPILNANHWVREMSEEPANVCNSEYMEQQAKKLCSDKIKVKVLNQAELEELNMHTLLGVNKGSVMPPKLIVIEYKNAPKADAKPFVFVGKGVIFDTGGISIKPANDMDKMKKDMTGAATVIGLMHAISENQLPVNAVGILAVVENMVSGSAQRPGDVVVSADGQTVEILNTDAEGRLILADALWYAQKFYQPEYIIDYATLTGAILIALGQSYAGLYSRHDEFAAEMIAAGNKTGEELWRMPLHTDFDIEVNSKVADIANLGSNTPYGGSNTAAAFLARFVNKDIAWAHLDIAGTAYSKTSRFYAGPGSTGFGVRLTYNWLVNKI